MTTKICKICKFEKPIDTFRLMKHQTKFYRCPYCKNCEKEYKKIYDKQYYEKNKDRIKDRIKRYLEDNKDIVKQRKKVYRTLNLEHIKQINKEYYEKNKKDILIKNKEYYEKNKNLISQRNKEYCENNKEKIKDYKAKWYQENKLEISKKQKEKSQSIGYKIQINEHARKRKKEDSVYKLKCQVRSCICTSFKRKGMVKSKKTEQIVGIPLDDLYYYLLNTFEKNYGYKWDEKEEVHIDHIKPLKYAKTEEDVIRFCHYTNLQLLKSADNLDKKDKLDWTLKKVN